MRFPAFLGLFLVMAFPVNSPAKPIDCADGPVVLSGTVKASKIRHEGNGQSIDCITLSLEKALLASCEDVGGGGARMYGEIQLVDTTGKLKLPKRGKVTVTGTLVPGNTAWYCRELGLLVSKVEPFVAPTKAADPVMWLCECSATCPSTGTREDNVGIGHLCDLRDKDPRAVAETALSLCKDIAVIGCPGAQCSCSGCKPFDAPCAE